MANKNFRVRQGLEVAGDATLDGDLTVTGNEIKSGSNNTAIEFNDVNARIAGELTITGNTIRSSGGSAFPLGNIAIQLSGTSVIIPGDLTVNGTTTNINTQNLLVEDKNITIGDVATPTDITAAGGGITLLGDTNKTITWNNSTDGWEFNQSIKVTGDAVLTGDLTVTGNDIKSSTATAITLSGTDVIVAGDLAVNGGDITTTQTTASLFNSTATTVNIGAGGTLAVNLGNANGSIVKGPNRFTSPTINAFTGSASSSRGLSISNGNGASAALARNAIVLRTYPTAGGARSQLLFENARGTETTPTALQNNDLVGEVSASGYATNGWVSDYVSAVPGVSYFAPTEAWANTGGPFPTAGTVTNAGTGYIVALQPSATTVTTGNGSRVNVLNINPQTFNQRSDAFNWNKGKTNSSSMATLSDDGSGKIGFSVIQPRATASTNFALVNFSTYRSSDGVNYTPTQSNDTLGSFKFNGNANTSTSPGVPGGPGVEIIAKATENWSATANGTEVNFFAIKTGTLDAYSVIGATPDEIKLNATTLELNDYTGSVNYATLNNTSATFTRPVGFPVDTAANWNAVTGSVGQQVCVSDSASGGNPNGMMAFWDTTNSRWSYIHDNTAV